MFYIECMIEKLFEGFEDVFKMCYWYGDILEGVVRVVDIVIEMVGLELGVKVVFFEEFIEVKFVICVNLIGVEKVELYNVLEKVISDIVDLKDVNVFDLFKDFFVYNKLFEEVKVLLDMV